MKFILEINLGNDAMRKGEDIAEALEEHAEILRQSFPDEAHPYGRPIRDVNGNTVGKWEVSEDSPVRRSRAERV